MVSPISSITNFIPYNSNINFRSNADKPMGLDFQPKLRLPLTTDVFEKTTNGGINGSKDTILKTQKLFPYAEIKQYAPSKRELERNKKIEQEKKHISNVVTKRTEYNTRQLRSAGVSEGDVKKYLTIDGHVNDAGKRILKEKGKSYQ